MKTIFLRIRPEDVQQSIETGEFPYVSAFRRRFPDVKITQCGFYGCQLNNTTAVFSEPLHEQLDYSRGDAEHRASFFPRKYMVDINGDI